jgi:hypothetical protein
MLKRGTRTPLPHGLPGITIPVTAWFLTRRINSVFEYSKVQRGKNINNRQRISTITEDDIQSQIL